MKKYVQQYDFGQKKALIRVDFNVPLDGQGRVVDDRRIRSAVPTVQHVLQSRGAAVLASHLGRPRHGYEPQYSLQQLVPCLTDALGTAVDFVPDCIGPVAQEAIQQLAPGGVLLLENVRFHAGEVAGDPAFAQALAAGTDVYVNDAFATAHRAHASTAVVAHYFADSLMGCLVQQELASIDNVMKQPQRPLTAIIGGAKVSDKMQPLAHLIDQVDRLLLGGGVANTFRQALGGALGASLVEHDQVDLAQQLMERAQQRGVHLALPEDVVVADRYAADAATRVMPADAIADGWMALDIGPRTQRRFCDLLHTSATILWCGPIGVFEFEKFRQGTQAVAAAVAQATAQGAFSLVGGGDAAAAVQGYAVSYVSTGGGALLAHLGDTPLPGLL